MKTLRRLLSAGILVLLFLVSSVAGDEPEEAELPIDYGVSLIKTKHKGLREVSIHNSLAGPITLSYSIIPKNSRVRRLTPLVTVVPPKSKRRLIEVRPIDPRKPWDYKFRGDWRHGDRKAVHSPGQRYRLPYAAGTSHRVIQSRGGFSHRGAARNAIDFAMPVGTLIHAARAGWVVFVVDRYREHGTRAELKDRGNVILVAHKDGSIANYGHLKPGGALVKLGDQIKEGQVIGRSGNTGYSAGPHLHFEVFRPLSGKGTWSLPLRFFSRSSESLRLRRGDRPVAFDRPPSGSPSKGPAEPEEPPAGTSGPY